MDTTILPIPKDEEQRLKALNDYQILDTASEDDFNYITQLASNICEVPIALISLIDNDRQWFKSRVGLETPQTHRNISFCQHAIMQDDIYEVTNALKNEIFVHNPLVTGAPDIRFYAGSPLKTPDGYNIGTLCVIDREERKLNEKQKESLRVLSNLAISIMESKKRKNELNQNISKSEEFIYATFNKLQAVFSIDARTFMIDDTNGFLKQTLSLKEEDLIGKPFTELIFAPDVPRVLELAKNANGKGGSFFNLSVRWLNKEGKPVAINAEILNYKGKWMACVK